MEHFIELWQQAKIDESTMDRRYQKEDVVPMIMNLEKKQQKLLTFKTLSVITLLLALLIVFLNRLTFTFYSILGIGIFLTSLITVIVLLNRLRFRITYEERARSTLQLAEIAERKINTERKIFTTYLPIFVMVALTGFNMMYLDFFKDEETGTRILYHMVMTSGIAVAFVVGLSVRIKRFRNQFLPLLARIRKFKSESVNVDLE